MLAHRGEWTEAPENSLAAFEAAAQSPWLDGVEFDVRGARDGTPVVIHDPDLRRVQGVAGRVADLTTTELRDRGVPLLGSVLEALPAPCFLDVELKEDLAAQVVPLLARARGDPPAQTVVSSFLPSAIESVRRIAPGWPTWLIHLELDERVVARAVALGCVGIAAEWLALRPAGVALTRDAGLQLATWTVEDRSALDTVLQYDLDAICFDPGGFSARSEGEV